jgi:hypothetical protein
MKMERWSLKNYTDLDLAINRKVYDYIFEKLYKSWKRKDYETHARLCRAEDALERECYMIMRALGLYLEVGDSHGERKSVYKNNMLRPDTRNWSDIERIIEGVEKKEDLEAEKIKVIETDFPNIEKIERLERLERSAA